MVSFSPSVIVMHHRLGPNHTEAQQRQEQHGGYGDGNERVASPFADEDFAGRLPQEGGANRHEAIPEPRGDSGVAGLGFNRC